uniref:uncharacterized protein LOC106676077 n=1 Tax=Maylandia zebra TaxID=106582 RepID=UPI000D3060B7|nr:uncharacterized protein LOC106676077 [Maylandia zebra]
MKQLYTVPFERNSERVKELRRQYVQRVMELEANQAPHEFIYIDEAGFNLAKRRRRGRNVIGKRATVDVPGQRGANITMCAAIANAGLLLHKCQVGPYNTERLLAFLNDLHQRLVPEQGQEGENMRTFVITWDNVAFHHSQAITTWFEVHPRLVSLFLPPYSPFLNPIEEFFSAWRWKVYDHQPHDQMSLLEAMDAGSRDITVDDCQGWIRHTRRFYPRCIDLADIRCSMVRVLLMATFPLEVLIYSNLKDTKESYKYLGIPQANGNHKDATRKVATTKYLHMVRQVLKNQLNGKNKIRTINIYVLPMIRHNKLAKRGDRSHGHQNENTPCMEGLTQSPAP